MNNEIDQSDRSGIVIVDAKVTEGTSAHGVPRFLATVTIDGWEIVIAQSVMDPGAVNIEIDGPDDDANLPRLAVHLNDHALHDEREPR